MYIDIQNFALLVLIPAQFSTFTKNHFKCFQQEVNNFQKNKAFPVHTSFMRTPQIGVNLRFYFL